ncbi:hypothetical protein GPECTOR_1g667 [Gonium pectorale]|uniref:Uncharacterized protein n=1 Tax=Gonium pectorale TaxID=33097 RepID=A0A150H542_GONPE|nr:hypothetical protein GPECTOR_1g667 [Gonium pectorale]|eukprot:KXZ56740.1 hypothetical protein GPECTOR_1g667 [Gonium pectorale]
MRSRLRNSHNFELGVLVPRMRAAEVLHLGAVPAGPGAGGAAALPSAAGVTLHLVQITPGTGALRPLPLPPAAREGERRELLLRYLGCHLREEGQPGQAAASRNGAREHATGGSCGVGGVLGPAESTVEATTSGEGGSAEPPVLAGGFDLVVCVRFLERAFMPRMAAVLRPGGFILFSTFVDGPGLRAFGRPQGREHVLQPEELSTRFFGPEQGFEVLRNEIDAIPDGREVSFFCARKLRDV